MTKKKYILAGALLIAAVFVIVGIIQGQPAQVFNKAINICLECVGLG